MDKSVVSIEILQVSRRGALASVAPTEGLSSQRSYCKALIKMSEPCNRKILFVQFGNCIHAIQKSPFSASRNLTFCYPNELNADIMLNPHPPTPPLWGIGHFVACASNIFCTYSPSFLHLQGKLFAPAELKCCVNDFSFPPVWILKQVIGQICS